MQFLSPAVTVRTDSAKDTFLNSCADVPFQHPQNCCWSYWKDVNHKAETYFFVVLNIQMVLVSVLVAVGQGNDGEGVDRFHQCPLCKCFCDHLTAVVWHCIPGGKMAGTDYQVSISFI